MLQEKYRRKCYKKKYKMLHEKGFSVNLLAAIARASLATLDSRVIRCEYSQAKKVHFFQKLF